MDPRKPSQLIPYLREHGMVPKRSLSQNFLIDENILRRIADIANITPDMPILEIGAGAGAITKTLLEYGAKISSVEIDERYCNLLRTFASDRLEVIHKDFLKFSFETDLKEISEPILVIGNIPFHITAPIIERLAENRTRISRVLLIVQKELGDRIRSLPGSKIFGSFSVFTQFYFDVQELFRVKPGSFHPKPSVDSACIELIPKKTLAIENPSDFFLFVRGLFSQRRKMIGPRLKYSNTTEVLKNRDLSPTLRPERLSLEDFIYLFQHLK